MLDALGERVAKAYRDLRAGGMVATAAALKEALTPKVAAADLPSARLRKVLHDSFWKSVNTQPDGTELK